MFSTYLIFPNNYGHPLIICNKYNHVFLSLHFSYFISHFTHLHIHITYHILMSYSILVIYPCLYMFHTYNLYRHMQSYTFVSYHGSFQVIYIFFLFISTCTYHYLHIITYNKLIYIFVFISKLILDLISRRSYRTYTYTEVLIHVLVLLSILYLYLSYIMHE